jgi:hypothetical protein
LFFVFFVPFVVKSLGTFVMQRSMVVDKPLAMTLEDTRAIRSAAKRAGKSVLIWLQLGQAAIHPIQPDVMGINHVKVC